MFAYDGHYTVWTDLKSAFDRKEYDHFAQIVETRMPEYRESRDDLRLLFYVGLNFDERCFDILLPYFTHWKETPPENFQTRHEAYLYAVQNSVPKKLQPEKHYMYNFFKVVGVTL